MTKVKDLVMLILSALFAVVIIPVVMFFRWVLFRGQQDKEKIVAERLGRLIKDIGTILDF